MGNPEEEPEAPAAEYTGEEGEFGTAEEAEVELVEAAEDDKEWELEGDNSE